MGFNNSLPLWLEITSLVFLITSIAIALIIVYEKRSPFKTVAWILVLVVIPIFGLVFYLFFGQEYRKNKMYSRKGLKDLDRLRRLTLKQLRNFDKYKQNLKGKIGEKEKMIKLLLNNSHSLLTTGNQVELLNNGEATFNSLLAEIKESKTPHPFGILYY